MAVDNRFQIYLGDETLPRINVEDADAPWQTGGVAIGGGWLPVEFSRVEVHPLTSAETERFRGVGAQTWHPPDRDREAERRTQRAAYTARVVPPVTRTRTEFSLDGPWLFQVAQGLRAEENPAAPDADDQPWHVIQVPGFWDRRCRGCTVSKASNTSKAFRAARASPTNSWPT